MKKKKKINIVLFGNAGVGKGTQALMLKEKYGLVHLSIGEILRDNISKGTELGLFAQKFIDKGNLIPDESTLAMMKKFVEENIDSNGFIFDGFPRTLNQATVLDETMKHHGMSIDTMFSIHADIDELKKRLITRSETSNRADDKDIEIINKRIELHNREIAPPVIDYYNEQNKLIAINGMQSAADTFEDICFVIDAGNGVDVLLEEEAEPVTVKKIVFYADNFGFEEDCIRTYTGKSINVFDTNPDTIDIVDIAHALSFQCRFGGHLPEFFSVAQHCINCCSVADEDEKFDALMHDVSEGLGLLDFPTPIKNRMPEYKVIEHKLMMVLAKKFNFNYPKSKHVEDIDKAMLVTEWHNVMLGNKTNEDFTILSMEDAEAEFLRLYHKYKK